MDSLSAQALRRISEFRSQDMANTAWSFATLMIFHPPLFSAISSEAIPKSTELMAQNLSNTAWAFATRRVVDLPLCEAISAAASNIITEFDVQGLANTLWSIASLLLPHLGVLVHIRRTVVSAMMAVEPRVAPGDRAAEVFHEVARYQNHLCQLVWSFSFADKLDEELGCELRELMLKTGRRLDSVSASLVGLPKPMGERQAAPGDVDEPELQLSLRGVTVVLKPPLWEVDAKGQLSSSGYYLSHFMQRSHRPPSPVLVHPDFEYGFVHRLDVPSSGLILAGAHFEGYALLQYEMHTYLICREYSVLLLGMVEAELRDINMPVNDFWPGQSYVDELGGRPAETHLKAEFHCSRRLRWSREDFCLVSIAIHTGRRHQIRVHVQWAGHPTTTDEKYSHATVLLRAHPEDHAHLEPMFRMRGATTCEVSGR